ncbi:Glyoxalase/bleomycin resistance protein/dioxygenase [Catenulispora acidiphila DSM 44928]|uniref:Glyoxalase/bleomycin resistance protein/dioxygenase n=1 Tax=Catenulispora acidiphila (strain DSM 44928 / JCM 14897 / NBRC 102108 / NRRL B-24433 / ID139908) TaxID=479433 RepID=C7QI47_CATAD|nr:VOC family protein [Catenulispora acidiphila]ACU73092.1 Glyoxalase/bleomycin resistance protein/dioxygenase [Catenulispora acidiphila DSM 44928]
MVDFKLEVVVLPVADVDRAKDFYAGIGFRVDVDFSGPGGFRVVHLTPPGSTASLIIGSGVTDAAPGSERGVHLVVDDVVAAREELLAHGVEVSEVFHDAGGVFHHAGTLDRLAGPHPERQSYGSFASFTDPDGNTFVLQEVTTRRPGRIGHVVYRTTADLEQALRDAEAAHGEYEGELGHRDEEWPAWYAAHMARAAGLGV